MINELIDFTYNFQCNMFLFFIIILEGYLAKAMK